MRNFTLMATAVLATLPIGLSAAALTLRDGSVVYGQFVSGTTQTIIFADSDGVRRRFDVDRILNIDFSSSNTAQANGGRRDQNPPDRSYQPPPNRPPVYDGNVANRTDERNNDGDWARLPRGTEIQVRTDESINSHSAAEGRTYPATIAHDIMDDRGSMVIPQGSEAQLIVRQVNEGGTLSNGNFVLDLDSIRVNGHRYRVSTVDLEAKDSNGVGANKRTGEMVGGGAVLGTLLGAIAGGGKGAGIGALAGAAAGGGVQVLTKGQEIRVPAETVLHFRLDQTLHLREMQ
jgi:hypothetical protein